MPKNTTPYISFVVTSRNDNHGGDMRKRMRIFTKALLHQCNKFQLNAELIFMEWNPIPNEDYLINILPQSGSTDYLKIRYIRVPSTIHEKHHYHKRLPVFQMIAKNAGIRRAIAPFIVCTNVDLLFSDELIGYLASKPLKANYFYRANRCDIPSSISEDITVEEQLCFSKENIIKRLGKNTNDRIFKNNTGVFFKYILLRPFLPVLESLKKILFSKEQLAIDSLDFDACGDFTLMSKKDWMDIDGYVELEMYSLHIDSMALFSAYALNKQQVILPQELCTFHISHTGGWEITDPIEKLKFYAKFPSLDWWSVWQAGLSIVQKKENFNINDDNWGLHSYDLEEIS
jgi:hypothetical protein